MYNNYYWLWDDIVSAEMCKQIIDSRNWENATDAKVYTDERNTTLDKVTRRTEVLFESSYTPLGCILQTYAALANKTAGWNFTIDFMEDIQVGKYGVDGHYTWHTDTGVPNVAGIQRKLSIVLMLNDPDSYEGGVFEIEGLGEPLEKLKQGSIIAFPSTLKHRVTPVTSGDRYSVVGWCNGPAFR